MKRRDGWEWEARRWKVTCLSRPHFIKAPRPSINVGSRSLRGTEINRERKTCCEFCRAPKSRDPSHLPLLTQPP